MDDMQIMDLCVATKYLEYAEVIQWNQTRHMMLSSIKPYLPKHQKRMTAQQLFPLPIDEKEEEPEKKEKHVTVDKEAEAWFRSIKRSQDIKERCVYGPQVIAKGEQ